MKILLVLATLGFVCPTHAAAADDQEVQRIVRKYDAVRPTSQDLALYELDWAPTLKAAKDQAAREGRPVFLIVVTNSFGDVCSGHC